MSRPRIGRNEHDRESKYDPKPSSTDTDYEDGPDETSTDEFSPETSIVPGLEVTPLPAPVTISYPSKMSSLPDEQSQTVDQGPPRRETPHPTGNYDGRPFRGPPDGYGPPSTLSTFSSKQSPYWDHNSQQTSTTPKPTPVQSKDDASSSEPTDSDFGLHNNGADNGPNRTPIYAAAGVVPVVVIIIIGFFIFCCLRKRRRQRQAVVVGGHIEEMKIHPKPVERPYVAPITPPSPPPQAALPQYSPSTLSSSHPSTASFSQPVILGPIPSGNNGAYLTGMDTSDLVSMRSGGVSRQGTVVDRDPFADGRSLEEAPPPYRPSSLPPASLASTSRHSSIRTAAPPHLTSQIQLIERSPFDDPEDDEVSDISGPTMGRETDAMSDVSELSYQIDPVIGRSPF